MGGVFESLLSILAGQSAFIEKFVLAACDQAWMALIAQEQAVTVAGVGEAWEWPEFSGLGMWIDLRWALEADDCFWVALFQQHIGPVASVDFVVVDESGRARQEVWNSVFALDVAGRALGAFLINSELIFAAGR